MSELFLLKLPDVLWVFLSVHELKYTRGRTVKRKSTIRTVLWCVRPSFNETSRLKDMTSATGWKCHDFHNGNFVQKFSNFIFIKSSRISDFYLGRDKILFDLKAQIFRNWKKISFSYWNWAVGMTFSILTSGRIKSNYYLQSANKDTNSTASPSIKSILISVSLQHRDPTRISVAQCSLLLSMKTWEYE